MIAMQSLLAVPEADSQLGGKNSTKNDPKRESRLPGEQENERIIGVSFGDPNTRKCECLNPPPRRVTNAERRGREYLTPNEVEKLMAAAASVGRHGFRDATMILLAYRHGLRVGELIGLRWDQVDLPQGRVHVRRLKNGNPSMHPLQGPSIRALRRIKREYPTSLYVFTTERNGPLTSSTFRKIVARAGSVAGMPFPVHPHQLRHGTGYYLANSGVDTRAIQMFLGHKNIVHTCVYTQLSPERFKDFWQD